jgi:hypothetical protein
MRFLNLLHETQSIVVLWTLTKPSDAEVDDNAGATIEFSERKDTAGPQATFVIRHELDEGLVLKVVIWDHSDLIGGGPAWIAQLRA